MKKILVAAVVVMVAAAFIMYFVYNKPHRDVRDESGINISAAAIFDEFVTNEAQANLRYLDKVVAVSGKVADISKNQEGRLVVVLETGDPFGGVACSMSGDDSFTRGDDVVIKGICKGYLADVVVTDAILFKPNPQK